MEPGKNQARMRGSVPIQNSSFIYYMIYQWHKTTCEVISSDELGILIIFEDLNLAIE